MEKMEWFILVRTCTPGRWYRKFNWNFMELKTHLQEMKFKGFQK